MCVHGYVSVNTYCKLLVTAQYFCLLAITFFVSLSWGRNHSVYKFRCYLISHQLINTLWYCQGNYPNNILMCLQPRSQYSCKCIMSRDVLIKNLLSEYNLSVFTPNINYKRDTCILIWGCAHQPCHLSNPLLRTVYSYFRLAASAIVNLARHNEDYPTLGDHLRAKVW